jgi:hypothetical protein
MSFTVFILSLSSILLYGKESPQRWQDTPSDLISKHDVAIAFEERIFDAVVEDLQMIDTKDNPQEAKIQGRIALELCWSLEAAASNLISEAPVIIETFQQERMSHTPIKVLYQLCYL